MTVARVPVLVSVIIPTYNWSQALRVSIASVLTQTYSDFELLVIGDCCSDDSEEAAHAMRPFLAPTPYETTGDLANSARRGGRPASQSVSGGGPEWRRAVEEV